MNTALFIYYRVKEDDAETETQVRSMMARLGCRTGVGGRLMKRRDDPTTWMEIYQDITNVAAFERVLAEMVNRYDLGVFLARDRVAEFFVADATPQPVTCRKESSDG